MNNLDRWTCGRCLVPTGVLIEHLVGLWFQYDPRTFLLYQRPRNLCKVASLKMGMTLDMLHSSQNFMPGLLPLVSWISAASGMTWLGKQGGIYQVPVMKEVALWHRWKLSSYAEYEQISTHAMTRKKRTKEKEFPPANWRSYGSVSRSWARSVLGHIFAPFVLKEVVRSYKHEDQSFKNANYLLWSVTKYIVVLFTVQGEWSCTWTTVSTPNLQSTEEKLAWITVRGTLSLSLTAFPSSLKNSPPMHHRWFPLGQAVKVAFARLLGGPSTNSSVTAWDSSQSFWNYCHARESGF